MWTYTILSVPVVLYMVVVFLTRDLLLGADYGTNYVTITIAVVCAMGGLGIAIARRKLLTAGVLTGMPELSDERYPGKLLSEGIYGRVRHPRYVEIVLLSLACLASFPAGANE